MGLILGHSARLAIIQSQSGATRVRSTKIAEDTKASILEISDKLTQSGVLRYSAATGWVLNGSGPTPQTPGATPLWQFRPLPPPSNPNPAVTYSPGPNPQVVFNLPDARSLSDSARHIMFTTLSVPNSTNSETINSMLEIEGPPNGSKTPVKIQVDVKTIAGAPESDKNRLIASASKARISPPQAAVPPPPVTPPPPVFNCHGVGSTFSIHQTHIQADGKILAVGQCAYYTQGACPGQMILRGLMIRRVNPNGTVDNTYGQGTTTMSGGKVFKRFACDDVNSSVGALQPSGKLVLEVKAQNPTNGTERSYHVRFNADGSEDGPIDADGSFMGMQPDGKLFYRTSQNFVRRLADGSVDTSWNFQVLSVASGQPAAVWSGRYAHSFHMIGAAGVLFAGAGVYPAMSLHRANGSLDTSRFAVSSWGVNKGVMTDLVHFSAGDPNGRYFSTNSSHVQPDGRIVFVGTYNPYSDLEKLFFAAKRYTANGSPDGSYGNFGAESGMLKTNKVYFPGPMKSFLLPANKIIVGLTTYTPPNFSAPRWTLARINANGTMDTTFGPGGFIDIPQTVTFRNEGNLANFNRQPDGKHLLTGYASGSSVGKWVVLRLNPDGTIDNTFGTNGQWWDAWF
jgi:uncharacterized delta-60 repeat protein